MEEHYMEDCKALLSQTKQLERDLRLKRRWLMGVNLSRREQDRMESLKPPNDKFVPESVLREDDLNYENIRSFVGKTLGVHKAERNNHVGDEDEKQLFESPKNLKYIISLLDEMTNKGLFRFAEIVTNGSVNFQKTKKKMRQIIKEFLPKLLECRDDQCQMKLKQLAQLLTDPQNFFRSEMALSNPSRSFRAACIEVLARLEELSFVTLSAMYRNLRGVKGYTPKLCKRPGWSLERLVKQVRRKSMEMLQEFCDGDEPPEPLSKALAVANLMLKPKSRTQFPIVSPDIEVLQNDIVKAIQIVKDKRKISHLELKKLQIMLDPDTEPSEKSCRVRVTMKNLLTEYLLECINMETIPKCLLETVRTINRTSQRSARKTFTTEEIQEEVNCLLHLSAQAKQIVWDSFPENEFDKDFADAYMEDVGECGDEFGYNGHDNDSSHSRNYSFNPGDLDSQSESVGETSPVDSKSPVSSSRAENLTPLFSSNRKLRIKLESMNITETNSVESHAFEDTCSLDENRDQAGSTSQQRQTRSHISMFIDKGGFSTANAESGRSHDGLREPKTELGYKTKFASSNFFQADTTVVNGNKSNFENQYLVIQEACDETSMFAYSFVGQVLNELARLDRLELPKDHISNLQADDAFGLINSKVPKRRQTFFDDGVGSVMINVLEVLMPSFPSREKEELKVLMGI